MLLKAMGSGSYGTPCTYINYYSLLSTDNAAI